jgi:hypothetical protein
MNIKINYNLFLNKKLAYLLIVGILLVIFFINPKKADAAIVENSFGIPTSIQNLHTNAQPDCLDGVFGLPRNHGQYSWISPQDDISYSGTLYVNDSATSIDLLLGVASGVCNRNVDGAGNIIDKNLQLSKWIYTGQPYTDKAGVTVTSNYNVGDYDTHDFGCSNMWSLRWVKQCFGTGWETAEPNRFPILRPLTLSGLQSLPTGINSVSVTVPVRAIHYFAGSGWICVNGLGVDNKPTNENGAGCGDVNTVVVVEIQREPAPDYALDATCVANIDNGTITFGVTKSGPGSADGITISRDANLNNPNRNISFSNITLNNGDFPWSSTYTINPEPDLGQSIDASITVTPGSRTGGVLGPAITRACATTPPRTAKPYFRAYGNDVIVGRKFEQDDGTCDINKNSSSIKAYVRGTAGSGSQFAASASNEIDGFMSSANHAGSGSIASPHFGLSFGNYDGLTPVADYPAGKDVSAYSGCILNYWESKGLNGNNIGPEVPVTESQGNLDSLAAGQIWHSEGDVHIQYNLSYTTGPNISGSEGIIGARGLMIVVRGGNITIAPNVDRIDAILIAMPDSDGNGGIVDTCYAENVAYSDCLDKKLTINGAVVAKKINLNRLKGDVANAGENELPSDNNIAEVINFPAYLYPAYAGSNAASGTFGTLGKYDAISGLPPVL